MNFVKRAFDVSSSFVALIILLIPFAIIALILVISQGKPVFLVQKRYGKDGKAFNIYKFRTMTNSAPVMASNDLSDAYITPIGRILRKTSVDELPQFLNVLKGDMSLVGPRPLIVEEEKIHKMREANGVYSVRPGLTGWAQINGRDDVSIDEKVELDKYYVDNISIGLDIKILFKSVTAVILEKGIEK